MPIQLSNPMRLIVPIGTLALLAVMFIPAIWLADWTKDDPVKLGLGASLLGLIGLWLAVGAWRVAFAARIDAAGVTVRKLMRETHYPLARIHKWHFAIPDGKPTRSPPATNGVLYLTFKDRTRFRAEVTAAEARAIADLFQAIQP